MSINHSLKSKSIVGVCHISEQYCHHVVVYDISLVSRGNKQHGFGVFRIKSNNIAEYKGISFETPRYLSFYRDTYKMEKRAIRLLILPWYLLHIFKNTTHQIAKIPQFGSMISFAEFFYAYRIKDGNYHKYLLNWYFVCGGQMSTSTSECVPLFSSALWKSVLENLGIIIVWIEYITPLLWPA